MRDPHDFPVPLDRSTAAAILTKSSPTGLFIRSFHSLTSASFLFLVARGLTEPRKTGLPAVVTAPDQNASKYSITIWRGLLIFMSCV